MRSFGRSPGGTGSIAIEIDAPGMRWTRRPPLSSAAGGAAASDATGSGARPEAQAASASAVHGRIDLILAPLLPPKVLDQVAQVLARHVLLHPLRHRREPLPPP